MPRSLTRRLLAIGCTLVLALLAARWWAGERAPEPEVPSEPVIRFVAPRFVGLHRGVRQWSLSAEAIEETRGEQNERVVTLIRVHDGQLYRDGEVALRFEAARGIWRETSSDLVLQGDVVFVSADGLRFETQEVRWNAQEERLVAPGPVEILYRDQRFTAGRLDADVRGGRYEFSGKVRWTTETGARVEAERAVYSDEPGVLEFFGLLGPAELVFGGD